MIPSIQMRSGCALYSSLHSECLSCGTSLAKISIKGSSATYSRRRRKRLLCVSCPGNHNRNTLVLLNCEGETEFPLKIRMQKFLCPADLMESMVLKLVSNEVRALIAPFFFFYYKGSWFKIGLSFNKKTFIMTLQYLMRVVLSQRIGNMGRTRISSNLKTAFNMNHGLGKNVGSWTTTHNLLFI